MSSLSPENGVRGHHEHHDFVFSDGQLTGFQDFDYETVDRGNPLLAELEEASPMTVAAEGLHEILAWCHKDGATNIRAAFIRFIAVSIMLEPRWLDNETMKQIGQRLGITKAIISKACVEFEEAFNLQFRRMRSKRARQAMSEARLKQRDADGHVIPRRRVKKPITRDFLSNVTGACNNVQTSHCEPTDTSVGHGSIEPNQ